MRSAQDEVGAGEVYVVLFEISHPDLEQPIRLSSDCTERLSRDPLIYGTRSTWCGADPRTDPYLWVVADFVLPSDVEDTPASAQLIVARLDDALVPAVRSFVTMATAKMAVVLASSPSLVEAEWHDLQIVSADIDAGQVTFEMSRDEIELEYFPTARMTRGRFPGLHL